MGNFVVRINGNNVASFDSVREANAYIKNLGDVYSSEEIPQLVEIVKEKVVKTFKPRFKLVKFKENKIEALEPNFGLEVNNEQK